MGEPWETIIRAVIAIGIAAFLWSVSSSLEQIARALTRLADARNAGQDAGVPDERSPPRPASNLSLQRTPTRRVSLKCGPGPHSGPYKADSKENCSRRQRRPFFGAN
jgi:hypothetical protein